MAQVHAKHDALLSQPCAAKAFFNDVGPDRVPPRNPQAALKIRWRIVLSVVSDFGEIQIRLDAERPDWRQKAFLDGVLQRKPRLMAAKDLHQRFQVEPIRSGGET